VIPIAPLAEESAATEQADATSAGVSSSQSAGPRPTFSLLTILCSTLFDKHAESNTQHSAIRNKLQTAVSGDVQTFWQDCTDLQLEQDERSVCSPVLHWKDVERRLRGYLDGRCGHLVVYYGGKSRAQDGAWVFEDGVMTFTEMLELWKCSLAYESTSKLVLIIDSPCSSWWRRKLNDLRAREGGVRMEVLEGTTDPFATQHLFT